MARTIRKPGAACRAAAPQRAACPCRPAPLRAAADRQGEAPAWPGSRGRDGLLEYAPSRPRVAADAWTGRPGAADRVAGRASPRAKWGDGIMEQNAFNLLELFGVFLFVMGLPVVIGLVAVITERE
jgi:hypothetical protein